MSLNTYLEQEIRYIEWFSKRQGVSIEEGCQLWVQQGLADLYAQKFRTDMCHTNPKVRAN